ncbi:uncharacterized protein LOC142326632 isoform X2 [Lycorma delicatula]|uniref:uncharacterized protein LOC142326632 isoform X2 n=1 Tax=Lycorma delicatula TaxID=130591 RepID=UPI003F51A717
MANLKIIITVALISLVVVVESRPNKPSIIEDDQELMYNINGEILHSKQESNIDPIKDYNSNRNNLRLRRQLNNFIFLFKLIRIVLTTFFSSINLSTLTFNDLKNIFSLIATVI